MLVRLEPRSRRPWRPHLLLFLALAYPRIDSADSRIGVGSDYWIAVDLATRGDLKEALARFGVIPASTKDAEIQRVTRLARAVENCGICRARIVFDTSGSLGPRKVQELAQVARQLTDRLRAGDVIELLPFDDRLRLAPVSDKAAADRFLGQLQPSGGTALLDAMFAGLVRAGPDRTHVIVFTDGEDNMSWLDERALAEVARRSTAVLQAGSIESEDSTEGRGREVLRRLCEVTGGRLWTSPSAAELPGTFGAALEAMHRRYLLRFEPTSETQGWHRLDVRLRGAHGAIRSRTGYWRSR